MDYNFDKRQRRAVSFINDFVPEIEARIPEYIQKEGALFIDQASTARISVAQRLKIVQKSFPDGYKLRLNCGYRSLVMQKRPTTKSLKKLISSY